MKKIEFRIHGKFLLASAVLSLMLAPGLTTQLTVAEEAESEAASQSSDDAKQTDRVGALNTEQLAQLALAGEARESERVWLEVTYDETGSRHDVLALEQRPRTAQAQGGVLILHDKEQHADWPELIRTLRMGLPDFGWYTLTVNLPYDEVRRVPDRELEPKQFDSVELNADLRQSLANPDRSARAAEKAASSNEGEMEGAAQNSETGAQAQTGDAIQSDAETGGNVDIDLADREAKETPALPYRTRAQYHLREAMNHLQSKGYQNIVVIGVRSGADLALEYIKPLAAQIPKQGFALVMVDPVLRFGFQVDLQQAFGKRFQAPVLDIVNSADLEARAEASEREAGARIADIGNYQQIRLVTNEGGMYQETLMRRIRAWMEKYAPGMAAKRLSAP